jgi:hypothetical protein
MIGAKIRSDNSREVVEAPHASEDQVPRRKRGWVIAVIAAVLAVAVAGWVLSTTLGRGPDSPGSSTSANRVSTMRPFLDGSFDPVQTANHVSTMRPFLDGSFDPVTGGS